MFTQIALQPVTLKARCLRLKGLNRWHFRRASAFSREKQGRGFTRTLRDRAWLSNQGELD
jgi:hypothetical protein